MDYRTVKYLDPKNDLTFRKIFGQHPKIMKSFLNSLLPLKEGQYIESLIYQDPALIPVIPELKHSVVDVKCTDNKGRQFLVEMQMYWTNSFKSRMLFNAGKAYVKQIDRGHKYKELLPVYGLSLVDDIYLKGAEYENNFYHHYKLAHHEIPNEEIEGIELIFIELPKFKPSTFTDKKIQNLWLRFLTEINEDTHEIDKDFYREDAIKEALEQLQISAFTKEELEYYDNYWDRVRIERAAIDDAVEKMKEAKKNEEQAKKNEEQAKKNEEQAKKNEEQAKKQALQFYQQLSKAVIRMNQKGFTVAEIAEDIGITKNEVQKILNQ